MHSVGKSGSTRYYEEEYEQGNAYWAGEAAELLGLETYRPDKFNFEDFRQLHNGYSPKGEPLVRNAGQNTPTWRDENGKARGARDKANDSTFSPEKRFSVFAECGGEEAKAMVWDCQRYAIRGVIDALEASIEARYAEGNTPAKIIVAVFEHERARPVDNEPPAPQVHSHLLIMNLVRSEYDEWRPAALRPVFENAKAIDAIYRERFLHRARELGIDGIQFPEEVIRAFSPASEKLKRELKKLDLPEHYNESRAKQYLHNGPRRAKDVSRKAEAARYWQEKGRKLGVTEESLKQAVRAVTSEERRELQAERKAKDEAFIAWVKAALIPGEKTLVVCQLRHHALELQKHGINAVSARQYLLANGWKPDREDRLREWNRLSCWGKVRAVYFDQKDKWLKVKATWLHATYQIDDRTYGRLVDPPKVTTRLDHLRRHLIGDISAKEMRYLNNLLDRQKLRADRWDRIVTIGHDRVVEQVESYTRRKTDRIEPDNQAGRQDV